MASAPIVAHIFVHHCRRWTGRPVAELVPQGSRDRSSGVGEAPRRPCMAVGALGHVLPRHAQLAMPAAELSVCRTRPARLHAAPGDHQLFRRVRRLVRSALVRGCDRDRLAQPWPARVRVGYQRRPLRRRSGRDRDRRLSDRGHPALCRATAARHRHQTQLGDLSQSNSCRRTGSWWSGADNPAHRSPRTCTSPAARCISLSAMRRALRAAIAARTWSTGCHLMGYYDLPVHEHPLREGVRDKTNHYVTGRDGGRDIDLRPRRPRGHATLWASRRCRRHACC